MVDLIFSGDIMIRLVKLSQYNLSVGLGLFWFIVAFSKSFFEGFYRACTDCKLCEGNKLNGYIGYNHLVLCSE